MKRTSIIVAIGLALAATLPIAPANAQNARSFVSGQGTDSNNCTLAAPCRTYQAAFNMTNAGGEILTLNPAGYGPVTINKSISIVSSPGVGGVNILTAGTAITINATATDIVSLRGLTIDGLGIGINGIQFNTGHSLTIENCVIRRFTSQGIYFTPNADSILEVSNSLVADNGDAAIYVLPSGSGVISAAFNRIEANNNGNNGIVVDGALSTGKVNVTVSESIATGNANVGIAAASTTGKAPTTLMLFRSVASNNGTGVLAQDIGATIRIANSMLTGNDNGWATSLGGIVKSYGNNSIDGNVANELQPPSQGLK